MANSSSEAEADGRVTKTSALEKALKALPEVPSPPDKPTRSSELEQDKDTRLISAMALGHRMNTYSHPQLEAAARIARTLEVAQPPAVKAVLHLTRHVRALREHSGQDQGSAVPIGTVDDGGAGRAPLPAPLPSAADLGAVVKSRRLDLSLTQQNLADLAGVGRRFVSELETGKSTVEIGKVLQVCASLGLDLFVKAR